MKWQAEFSSSVKRREQKYFWKVASDVEGSVAYPPGELCPEVTLMSNVLKGDSEEEGC